MFVWFYLYDFDVELGKLGETLFGVLGIMALLFVKLTGFSVGFFTTYLLSQYIIYIMIAVYIFNTRFIFRKALCLGFLTVFLNSFYWEFFYHIYEVQIWLPMSLTLGWWYLRIPQLIRLIPLLFLYRNFEFKDTRAVQVGLLISFFLTYARFVWRVNYMWLHPLHRVISLSALIYTIYMSPSKGNMYEK